MGEVEESIRILFVKVLIPALVAVSIKLAITGRKKSISVFSVFTSIITGVGFAYLFSPIILNRISEDYIPLMIALVSISGEKIGTWLIFKLNLDTLIEALIEKYYKK